MITQHLTAVQKQAAIDLLTAAFGPPETGTLTMLRWRSELVRASLDTYSGVHVRVWAWPDRAPDDLIARLTEAEIPYRIITPSARDYALTRQGRRHAPGVARTLSNKRDQQHITAHALALLNRHAPLDGWTHARWEGLPEPTDPRIRVFSGVVRHTDIELRLGVYVAPRRWLLLAALQQLPEHPSRPWILFPVGTPLEDTVDFSSWLTVVT